MRMLHWDFAGIATGVWGRGRGLECACDILRRQGSGWKKEIQSLTEEKFRRMQMDCWRD